MRSGIIPRKRGAVHAVENVSFQIHEGSVLGLVGESGCGKTTVARLVLRLIEADKGEVMYRGMNIYDLNGRKLKDFRRKAQIIFQNPFLSLNPRKTLRYIIGEPIKLHGFADELEVEEKVLGLLDRVGLNPEHIDRYPHELSGGQKQRVAIARALGLSPDFLVLDEPTSSLDVSVQAVILTDLRRLQKEFGLTLLFISHNLGVIRHMSDYLAVMYLGQIVELAPSEEFFKEPLHPYSQVLLSAIPVPDPSVGVNLSLPKGEVPSPINPPKGCRFHTRCPYALNKCGIEEPSLLEVKKGHFVSCFLMTN